MKEQRGSNDPVFVPIEEERPNLHQPENREESELAEEAPELFAVQLEDPPLLPHDHT